MNATDPIVEIRGWRAKGAIVTVNEYQPGFSNRRNRWKAVREDSKPRGRNFQGPAHELVHRVDDPGYDMVAFNVGHLYVAIVTVDGAAEELDLLVDATDDYQVVKIADGVVIERVETFDHYDEYLASRQPAPEESATEGGPAPDENPSEDGEDATASSSGSRDEEE